MLLVAMTEAMAKNIEGLDARIEALLAGLSAVLEACHNLTVQCIPSAALLIGGVDAVGNGHFTGRELTFETVGLAKDHKIVISSLKWTVDPYNLVVKDGNAYFVGKARLVVLERVPFGRWLSPWLVDVCVHAIHCNNVDFIYVCAMKVGIIP